MNELFNYSNSNPIAIYDMLSEQVVAPQELHEQNQFCTFVRRSQSGLSGSFVTKGPGKKVIKILDRHHVSSSIDKIVAIRKDGLLFPVEIKQSGLSNGYCELMQLHSIRNKTTKIKFATKNLVTCSDNPFNLIEVTTNMSFYDTTTIMLHLLGCMFTIKLNEIVEDVDMFSTLSSRAIKVKFNNEELWFNIARLPGNVGDIENLVLTAPIPEELMDKIINKNVFKFMGVKFRFCPTSLHDGTEGFCLRAETRDFISSEAFVERHSFENADSQFRNICNKLSVEVLELCHAKRDAE